MFDCAIKKKRCRLVQCLARWRILTRTRVLLSTTYHSSFRIDDKTAADDEGVQLCCQEGKGPVWSVPLADRASCSRAMPSTSMFRLSVHASRTTVVRQVGCLATCEMRSMESYLAPHPGRVPWVACGRGASRHSFDFDIQHAVDFLSLGRDVNLSFQERADTAHCQLPIASSDLISSQIRDRHCSFCSLNR